MKFGSLQITDSGAPIAIARRPGTRFRGSLSPFIEIAAITNRASIWQGFHFAALAAAALPLATVACNKLIEIDKILDKKIKGGGGEQRSKYAVQLHRHRLQNNSFQGLCPSADKAMNCCQAAREREEEEEYSLLMSCQALCKW